ncbi:MAG: hypothetical protein AB8B93_11705 [Pseudomonadales bacterium]
MQAIIESGAIVTVMLVFVAIEVVALIVYWRRTGRGIDPLSLVLNVGAGTSLMLALRSEILAHGWQTLAAWLICALFFHCADLLRRWRTAA